MNDEIEQIVLPNGISDEDFDGIRQISGVNEELLGPVEKE